MGKFMRPRKRVRKSKRCQVFPPQSAHEYDLRDWDRLVDVLSMHLCPADEWQAYEKKVQYQNWKSKQKKQNGSPKAKVCVFPIWRKYRGQARKIASLHQVIPMLRHLPLPVSSFLGKVFF